MDYIWSISSGEYEDYSTWGFSVSAEVAYAYLKSQRPKSEWGPLEPNERGSYSVRETFDKHPGNPDGITEYHRIRREKVVQTA